MLVPGSTVAHYRVVGRLATGARGEVYRAEDCRLGRSVALKVFPLDQLDDAARSALQEARTGASVQHQHLVSVYDVGSCDGFAYEAMELVEGESLEQRLHSGPLEIAEALRIGHQIAQALDAAHDREWVHCDLKPANVLLNRAGDVKLADFGLATPLEEGGVDTSKGTPGYMSPEQIRGDPIDHRSDLFSLGVLLFEMTTGRRPFERETTAVELAATLHAAPLPMTRAPGVPLELESLVRRALARDPAKRFASAEEVAASLDSLRRRLERRPAPTSASQARQREVATRATASRSWVAAARWLWLALAFLTVTFGAIVRAPPAAWWVLLAVVTGSAALIRPWRLRRSRSSFEPEPSGSAFRGLVPFSELDRERFFGRRSDEEALLGRVSSPSFRFGVLYGDSGSGKTSLLQAGLVPRLRQLGLQPLYCRVGDDPIAALIRECSLESQLKPLPAEPVDDYLRRVSTTLRADLVLIFDQFEETFVRLEDESARKPLLSLVARCARAKDVSPPIRVVVSLRSDFLYRIDSELAGRIEEPLRSSRLYHLHPLTGHQAAEILSRSVAAAGLPLETTLIRQLTRDLERDQGGRILPSELQIVGEQIQRRELFRLADYRRAGGKERLVHEFLEDTLRGAQDNEGAHLVLQSLISEDGARLALSVDELARSTQRAARQVESILRLLVGARLVRELQDKPPWRYELVHEYLIDRVRRVSGQLLDARQRANRLLAQYQQGQALDRATLIPLGRLRFVWRHADGERLERSQDLLRRSLRIGLLRWTAAVAVVLTLVGTAAALFSVREEWPEQRLRDGHSAAVRRALYSPDGRLLVSGGEDGRLIVWDAITRRRLLTHESESWILSLAFSPDGERFAGGTDDSQVLVWSSRSLEIEKTLAVGDGAVVGLAFSPDDSGLVTLSQRFSTLWSMETGRSMLRLEHGSRFGNVELPPGDERLLFHSGVVYHRDGTKLADTFDNNGSNWVSVAPGGGALASLDALGQLSWWALESPYRFERRRLIARRRAHNDHGRAVTYSPDGRLLATGADDIVLWDTATHSKLARLEHPAVVWSLSFSPDGRRLLATYGDGAVLEWDVAERERSANLNEHTAPVRAIAFSPDGQLLASASEDRSVLVWNTETGAKVASFHGHQTRVNAVAFFPDGRRLASGDQDGVLRLWDLEGSQAELALGPGGYWRTQRPIYGLAMSPDGSWIASSAGVWAEGSSRPLLDGFHLADDRGSLNPYSLAAVAGGPLATVDGNGWLVVWSTDTWEPIAQVDTGEMGLVAVDVSPSGSWAVTGGDAGVLRLFDLESLRDQGVLGRHHARIKSVAYSPDGGRVASASDDGTVRIWDPERRRELRVVVAQSAPVLAVAFSRDGRLAAAGHDNSVRLYARQRSLWGRVLERSGSE